jgi:hypothetical protein
MELKGLEICFISINVWPLISWLKPEALQLCLLTQLLFVA